MLGFCCLPPHIPVCQVFSPSIDVWMLQPMTYLLIYSLWFLLPSGWMTGWGHVVGNAPGQAHRQPLIPCQSTMPRPPPAERGSSSVGVLVSNTLTFLPTYFQIHCSSNPVLSNSVTTLQILIDSRAEDNFIDHQLAIQYGFPLEPLETPLTANALNGNFLASVLHQTSPIMLILSVNHSEKIPLCVISSPTLVLGR